MDTTKNPMLTENQVTYSSESTLSSPTTLLRRRASLLDRFLVFCLPGNLQDLPAIFDAHFVLVLYKKNMNGKESEIEKLKWVQKFYTRIFELENEQKRHSLPVASSPDALLISGAIALPSSLKIDPLKLLSFGLTNSLRIPAFSAFLQCNMDKKIIITIDGWSSCGKSTLAKQLARELGYVYIDSGAMYRSITLYFLRNHVDWTNPEAVHEALGHIKLQFHANHKNGQSEIFLNDENVEYVIRDLVVAEKVSEVAAIREVREYAVKQQQEMGRKKGIVMDGRDIGTVVFPDAELKIFMTADNAIRVQRRFKELYEKNPNVTIEEVRANLEMRDYIDSHREVSPLRQAEDALVLDNSHLTIRQQLDIALGWVKERL